MENDKREPFELTQPFTSDEVTGLADSVRGRRRAALLAYAATLRQQPAGRGGMDDVSFSTVEKVVKALCRIGHTFPESQEEQAARFESLVLDLCRSVQSHFDELTTAQAALAQNTQPAVAVSDEAALMRAVRAHDREEAAQNGEPDPWADEFPEPYRSERLTAMRCAFEAATLRQQGGRAGSEPIYQYRHRGAQRGFDDVSKEDFDQLSNLPTSETRIVYTHADRATVPESLCAKPIVWSGPERGEWWDDRHGFHIGHDPEEDEPFVAAWGEGEPERFATIDEAKAWCQSEIDDWVRENVALAAAPSQPEDAQS